MPIAGRSAYGSLRTAVSFLTRFPVGHGRSSDAAVRWAPAHFPLVGAALGALGALLFHALDPLDPRARAWAVVAGLALATGALHEDGLADTADALGGAPDRERLFAILKDSRIGTFGAVALCCCLALRAELLSSLLPHGAWTLVTAQTVSRLAPVVLLGALPYVTPSESSRSRDMTAVRAPQILVAGGWTLLVLFVAVRFARAVPGSIAWALLAQTIAVAWLAYRFRVRAGGVTGDFLGATQQVGEIAFLLGLSLGRG